MVNNKNTIAILFLLLCGIFAAQGQNVKRRIYPAPKLTPEVERIRTTMRPFKANRNVVVLPKYVDNSTSKYFPPIINQDGGSCAQASSIGYLFTYEINRLLDRDASESAMNRFSYKFSWNMVNGGEDQGGFAEEGLFLSKKYGMMTEADYGKSGTYQFKWATGYSKYYNAMKYRTEEILTFPDSIELLKRYLYDAGDGSHPGGLLAFSTQSGNWSIDNYYDGPSGTGYHSLLKGLATTGAHAMTIVGYDDLVTYTDNNGVVHNGAFIVANTWGTYSHDRGRFYLPYDFFRDASVPEIQLSNKMQGAKVCTYEPKVVFKIRLKYTSRNDLSFGTAFTGDGKSDHATLYSYASAFYNQGGDYPMQGQYLSDEIEIAIDATPCIMPAEPQNEVFYLAVRKSAIGARMGKGQVESVSLIDYRSGKPMEYPCRSTVFPADIKPGLTEFSVAPGACILASASAYKYIEDNNATDKVFLIRTADGQNAKLRFSNLDSENGTIDIRYNTK